MYCAIGVEPTKLIACTSSCDNRASTAILSPLITLNTPSGNPASLNNSAINRAGDGSFSEGFKIKVLPQAMATGNIHMGTMTGKLKGVIPTTTPSGCISDQESTPVPTFLECSPFNKCGIPQANSITSSPRVTSPAASLSTFPCSAVIIICNFSRFCSTKSLNLNITRARLRGEVSDHAGKAVFAADTAVSTSLGLAKATLADCLPVAGLYTAP